jgi:hypothetical protein
MGGLDDSAYMSCIYVVASFALLVWLTLAMSSQFFAHYLCCGSLCKVVLARGVSAWWSGGDLIEGPKTLGPRWQGIDLTPNHAVWCAGRPYSSDPAGLIGVCFCPAVLLTVNVHMHDCCACHTFTCTIAPESGLHGRAVYTLARDCQPGV